MVQEFPEGELKQRFAAIDRATARLQFDFLEKGEDGFYVELPFGPNICGFIKTSGDKCVGMVEFLEVEKPYRNHGIGERLVKNFFRYCAEREVDEVDSGIINPIALRIYGRLFGEQAMHFYDDDNTNDKELPMTVEQACQSIERAEALERLYAEQDIDLDVDTGITVIVKMNEVATRLQDWELPTA